MICYDQKSEFADACNHSELYICNEGRKVKARLQTQDGLVVCKECVQGRGW